MDAVYRREVYLDRYTFNEPSSRNTLLARELYHLCAATDVNLAAVYRYENGIEFKREQTGMLVDIVHPPYSMSPHLLLVDVPEPASGVAATATSTLYRFERRDNPLYQRRLERKLIKPKEIIPDEQMFVPLAIGIALLGGCVTFDYKLQEYLYHSPLMVEYSSSSKVYKVAYDSYTSGCLLRK